MLLHIFNLSLSTGTFPFKWKDSFLIPIFKTGKRNDVGNYRGVAILSCFAKLYDVKYMIIFDYIFINDVFSCFKSLRILLYADDLKIFFPVADNGDFANVQAELDVFSQWCIDSGMQLNLGKCKSMNFTRVFQYEYRLDSVDSICDLGVVLGSKLNFTSHIDSLIVKASRMLGYIRRVGKEFRDPYTLKTLYNSFVRFHLDYASVVWNPYYGVQRIEATQKKFLKFALRTLG
jgi:hypothetical protein